MKKRNTLLDILSQNCKREDVLLVKYLKEEIQDFYKKMDLYYGYDKNLSIINKLYFDDNYLTYDEICEETAISKNTLQAFITTLNEFVYKIIIHYKKYENLRDLLKNL